MLVPDSDMKSLFDEQLNATHLSVTSTFDLVDSSEPSRDTGATMPTPDATMSGFAIRPTAGPRELKAAIWSSFRDIVPNELEAPTVMTHGASAGDAMPPHTFLPFNSPL